MIRSAHTRLCSVLAGLTMCLATSVAWSAEEKLLEPKPLLTTEQQANKMHMTAYTNRYCPQLRVRNSLMDMFPAYLVDKDGKKGQAEYKFVAVPGDKTMVLRITQLLPDDHPSGCKIMGFVVDIETGKLDVGAYEWCGKDHAEQLRYSDAYYWDQETKSRKGVKHKLRWDIQLRRLMWKTEAIAEVCRNPAKLTQR